MNIETIQQYMIKLGWQVDKASYERAQKATGTVERGLNNFSKSFDKVTKKIGQNPVVRNITRKAAAFLTVLGRRIAAFLATTTGMILGAIAVIGAAAAALFAALVVGVHKFVSGVAKADMQLQIFARRMLTTVSNARFLKNAMEAMGIDSLEELNDVALNPELRAQFLELRRLSRSQGQDPRVAEGLKAIRAFNFQFTKLQFLMSYFFTSLAGYIGKLSEGPLKFMGQLIDKFGQFMGQYGDRIAYDLAEVFAILVKIVTLGFRLSGMILRIPGVGQFIEHFIKQLETVLDIIDFILNGLMAITDIRDKAFDDFGMKAGQSATSINSPAFYVRKIYEFLTQVWNFFYPILRPIKDTLFKLLPKKSDVDKTIENVKQTVKQVVPAVADFIMPGTGSMVRQLGAGGRSLQWGTKDASSPQIKGFVNALSGQLNENYTVTAAKATKGHVSHGGGLALDIGLAGKSDASIIDLIHKSLNTGRVAMANLEVNRARYQRIIAQMKAAGDDTSKVTNYTSRFSHGDHLHNKLYAQPQQAKIDINVYNHDHVAQVRDTVTDVLSMYTGGAIRSTQAGFL